jgi:succinylglutamate desuccinylase
MLNILENLPPKLLEVPAEGLHELLGGPTLIHLPGREPAPLFVSVLLHGNESTGFYAVQALLRDYRSRELPRALSLFIGNVAAASEGQRYLDTQPDYNRAWPGTEFADLPEVRMMQQLVEIMAARRAFASIDVHNNTGINPHYACINRIDNRFLHLAALFSRTVVYFIRPLGVQSMAMSGVCPATTIECGKSGRPRPSSAASRARSTARNMRVTTSMPACTCTKYPTIRWRRTISTCFTPWRL